VALFAVLVFIVSKVFPPTKKPPNNKLLLFEGFLPI